MRMCSSVSCTSCHVNNEMVSSTRLNPPASKRSRQCQPCMKIKTGPDNISSHMLRNTARSILQLPSEWKVSNVILNSKGVDTSQCSPIDPSPFHPLYPQNSWTHHSQSTTKFSAKALSYLPLLVWFLSKQLHARKPSFNWLMNGTSTLILKAMLLLLFIDLLKTFDTAPLLENLQHAGVSGSLLTWFEDYLSDRFQHVVLDGHTSLALPVTSGIPHGFILWPLLFHHFRKFDIWSGSK